MKFIPDESKPISTWLDVIIRIILPLAIFGILLSVLIPEIITSINYSEDSKYGYTGKEGYTNDCQDNLWFYNLSKSICNELGVYH